MFFYTIFKLIIHNLIATTVSKKTPFKNKVRAVLEGFWEKVKYKLSWNVTMLSSEISVERWSCY